MYDVNLHGVIASMRAAARVHSRSWPYHCRRFRCGNSNRLPRPCRLQRGQGGARRFQPRCVGDLAPRNITVNVVLPGFTDTDMVRPFKTQLGGLIESIALHRFARPEEIAAGIAFLASPAASYVTGTILNIDGGPQRVASGKSAGDTESPYTKRVAPQSHPLHERGLLEERLAFICAQLRRSSSQFPLLIVYASGK